ncbi:Uncharacterised protein [uncultured archaeon]|nr:Uncharacterised protein [uncultured archaeon]
MADSGVAKYVGRQKPAQQKLLRRLIASIRKALPGIRGEMRLGVPWFGEKLYLAAFDDHVNMGFSVSGLPKKEKDLFLGKGNLMRHLKFFSLDEVEDKKIIRLVKIAQKSGCGCP